MPRGVGKGWGWAKADLSHSMLDEAKINNIHMDEQASEKWRNMLRVTQVDEAVPAFVRPRGIQVALCSHFPMGLPVPCHPSSPGWCDWLPFAATSAHKSVCLGLGNSASSDRR